MRVPDIEIISEVFVHSAVTTKLTLGGRSGVGDVPSVCGDILFEVLGTRLTGGWIDVTVFDVGTVNLLPAES